MRMLLLSLCLVFLGSCTRHDPLYCDENTPCTLANRPFCDLDGLYPGSDGHGRTCVPNPFDAGLPDGLWRRLERGA